MEEWRDIKGYEELYQVSNEGRVKSKARLSKRINPKTYRGTTILIKEKILKQSKQTNGYNVVLLCNDGGSVQKTVHRLVAETFIPNPENKPEIDHCNTIRTDNRVENLRWCTHTENMNNGLTKLKKMKNI